ncbi:MAG: helix-turn-helix domain-containing protein [Thermoplasmata archaeon]|nr:helix-turn-helix domain-containing protein [Thermoplasmata archaeon]
MGQPPGDPENDPEGHSEGRRVSLEAPGVKLADMLSTTPQNVSYHLRALESKGFVEIAEHRRAKTVVLSSTGRLFARIF